MLWTQSFMNLSKPITNQKMHSRNEMNLYLYLNTLFCSCPPHSKEIRNAILLCNQMAFLMNIYAINTFTGMNETIYLYTIAFFT